ncbi:MAG: hypothetical protein JSV49_12070 [Thermoplasmata archaeon]|nr:MAG: hypothetical protein JSV49_12070 [Thermoplasmata archaeon]
MTIKFFILKKVMIAVLILFMISSTFGIISPISGDSDSESGSRGAVSNSRNSEYERDVFVDTIAVNSYFIVPGVFADKHFPGQQVNLTTKIWNLGNKSITTPFDVLMVILDDVKEVDVNYEIHMRRTVNSMASKMSLNLSWTWTPPAEPPEGATWSYEGGSGGHSFKVRVISLFDGDENSSNNFNASQVDIEEPKFSPTLTNTIWGDYEVYETPLKQTIPIGSILYLNFTVNNTASAEDFIKIDVYDLPPDWIVLPGSLPDFLQLKGNRGQGVTLRIQISRNNSLALKAYDYPVKIRAYSLFSPPKNDTFQFIVNLEYSALAKFILPRDITLLPGSHLIDVTLMNIGNGRDIFTTSTEVFPASDDWKSTVYSGTKTRLLKTFETTTITLRVEVPPKKKDSYKTIIVTAHSIQDPKYSTTDEYHFKIYVGQYHDVDLRLTDDVPQPILMTPSSDYSFEMILRNTGNTKDPTISVNATDYPEGWKILLETSNIPKAGLGRGKEVVIGVLITTPVHVLMGDYTITISGLAGTPNKAYDNFEIDIKIIEVGDIHIEARPASKTGNIGDIVQYKVFIKNTGNREDTYDIQMREETTGMYGWGKLSQTQLTLEANMSYEIVLTVTIPLNASADTNPNTPSIWEGYTIEVTAKSQNLSHVSKTVDVVTNVNQYYDFDISADAYIKPVIRSINEPVAFYIMVENRGNVKDTFEFIMDSPYKWGRLLTKYKAVKPGEIQTVKFEANAPEDIGVGSYDFDIIVTSQGDSEKFRYITLSVFVSSLELSLTKIKVSGAEDEEGKPIGITGGNTVLITAQIKNTGSVLFDNETFLDCNIVFFDGKTTIARETIGYLPPQGVINISIPWNVSLISQEMTIFVNLDPNEDIPFSDRTNLSRTANVVVHGQEEEKDLGAEGTDFQTYLLPILIIIILIIIQVLALTIITRQKKSRIKVGYTADGEYRPFADVFDPFGEEKQLEGEGDPEHPYRLPGGKKLDSISITTTDKPMLPPSTVSVRTTAPIIRTKPLPRTAPVMRKR